MRPSLVIGSVCMWDGPQQRTCCHLHRRAGPMTQDCFPPAHLPGERGSGTGTFRKQPALSLLCHALHGWLQIHGHLCIQHTEGGTRGRKTFLKFSPRDTWDLAWKATCGKDSPLQHRARALHPFQCMCVATRGSFRKRQNGETVSSIYKPVWSFHSWPQWHPQACWPYRWAYFHKEGPSLLEKNKWRNMKCAGSKYVTHGTDTPGEPPQAHQTQMPPKPSDQISHHQWPNCHYVHQLCITYVASSQRSLAWFYHEETTK